MIDYDRLRALTVQDALATLGETARRNQFRCVRPDHEDRKPACSIYNKRGRNLWHCHVCGVGGDAIDLIQQAHGLDNASAARLLARSHGILERASDTTWRPQKARLRVPHVYEATAYEHLTARWSGEQIAVTFECRLPRVSPALAGHMEYLDGELARMRAAWREKEKADLYLSDFWKVGQIRAWYRWSLLTLAVRLPAGQRVRSTNRARTLAF